MIYIKQKINAIFSFLMWNFLLATPFYSYAQSITVTGTVQDEGGVFLPGATIKEKETTNGTITDIDGQFSLLVKSTQSTLLISSVGFEDQTVELNGKDKISITLKPALNQLSELIVVAYNTTKKANLTGAVSSVKMSEIDGLPISNAATALQGRMAGVTVSSFTGQPGKNDPVIRIRGIGTFGNNAPLVIIDGVPNEVGALGDISVDDIDNISVLKDAASAAIYGVRAGNGVILVTTKRGAVGKPKIQYRATYSTQKPIIKPRYMDGVQYATAYNDFLVETGAAPAYTAEMIQKIKDSGQRYTEIDRFRRQVCNDSFEIKCASLPALNQEHEDSMIFLQALYDNDIPSIKQSLKMGFLSYETDY